MKNSRAPLALLVALAACSDSSPLSAPAPETLAAPQAALYSKGADAIDGDYIVVFKDDVAQPLDKAEAKALKHGAKLKFKYDRAIKGFAATLTPGAVAALRDDPDVAYIEEDGVVTADATQSNPVWGLDRLDQRNRPLSNSYSYTATGSTVTAYIIDTGIETTHPEFGGRAAVAYDALGGNGQDCNGHGTHVAGTVGSATYGVAKGVKLRAVRVLDCNGSGANSGVIAGMNWVAANHVANSVANMSLGGSLSSAMNTAAANMTAANVFLAVAAGNSNADACGVSPASAPSAVTVAATTSTDGRATYSNYGSCVDLYAPGSSVKSTWLKGGTSTQSGTSMASPHVAGTAALYKATYGDASPATIAGWLNTNATASVVSGNVGSTPNRLLYKGGL